MSDFSDRLFAAGSLTGIRTFRIDKHGRLMASQLNAVWTPGENVAKCLKHMVSSAALWFPTYSSVWTTLGATYQGPLPEPTPQKPELPRPKRHRAGQLNCSCGFYAYFDGQPNPYHASSQLQGVVEGYGICTVGDRGFRAEKARILALVIKPNRETVNTAKVRRLYPDVPVFDRKTDALARFPLTPPEPVTPDSDPDFWTRDTL